MRQFVVLLSVFILLFACNKESNSQRDVGPVVKIGVLYPMSGDGAFFGDSAKKAAGLFFKEFDAKNAKYRYDIVWEDSQSSPAKAVMAARKLIDYDKVDVIYDMLSGVAVAVSPITNEKKVLHLTFAQDPSISKGFYNWRVVTSQKNTGIKMINALKKQNMFNLIGVVENTAGTLSLYNSFADLAEKDKDFRLETRSINPGERDFNLLLQKIESLKPDALVVSLHAPEIDVFMRQVQNNQIKTPIVGMQSFTFLKDKSLAEGLWYVDVAMADKSFLKRYKDFSGDDVTNFAENFYTLLLVTTHVYETAKIPQKPTHEEFIANLESVEGLISPVGKLMIDKVEQNVDAPASIRYIRGGIVVTLEED